MNRKTILIVGAGVSGLTAGIYALKSGYHVILLEKNPSVGGLCTGWYRKGRYLDGCIHWLTGTNEGNDLNNMWHDVGALEKDTKIIQLGSWGTFEYQGQKVTFWSDLKRAEKEWIEISPIDKKEIKHFFKMVKDIMSVDLPLDKPVSMMNPFKVLKLGLDVLNVWPSYLLTMRMSCEQYAKRFKSEAIRWAITHAQPGAGNLYSMLFCYGTIASGNGGIPEGGSKAMVERMKNRFLSLGGTLKLNTPVSHILKKGNKAVGVVTNDGEKYYADYVISALDPHYTLNHLLLNQYSLPKFEKRYDSFKKNPTPSCCMVILEAKDIKVPVPYSFECEPFYVGGELISHITIRNHNYDKDTFVKNGKTIISVLIDQYSEHYQYWNKLYKENPMKYRLKKEQLGLLVMNKIIKKIPEMQGNIEVLDVFTPKTLNRYTNSSRGAYMGFLFTKNKGMFAHNGMVKNLNNFIMTGQWMQCPGGLPLALSQGKFAIQRINKIEHIKTALSTNRVYKKENA